MEKINITKKEFKKNIVFKKEIYKIGEREDVQGYIKVKWLGNTFAFNNFSELKKIGKTIREYRKGLISPDQLREKLSWSLENFYNNYNLFYSIWSK